MARPTLPCRGDGTRRGARTLMKKKALRNWGALVTAVIKIRDQVMELQDLNRVPFTTPALSASTRPTQIKILLPICPSISVFIKRDGSDEGAVIVRLNEFRRWLL